MTLEKIIGPVAAATIINLIWFAAIWRGHQHERRQGKTPWQFDVALGAYIAANGLALYLSLHRSLTTGLDLFGAVFASEALGIVITYGLVYSFVLSRNRPWSERAWPMVCTLALTAGTIGAILIT